jgi:hypothetical protein
VRLADDLHVGLGVDDPGQHAREETLIVDDHDANRVYVIQDLASSSIPSPHPS